MKQRADIQGIRALAVLLVFIFHLEASWLPGGFVGVDIFFVVSGYLMTTIITRQVHEGRFSLIDFYRKRFNRLAPAYFILLFFVAVVGSFLYLYTDIGTLRGSLFRASVFISNTIFQSGESYFGTKLSENPLLHTWSLAIEMQFYLLLPILLILVHRKWIPYLFAILIFSLSIFSEVRLYDISEKSSVYFSLPARIPEFLVGGLIAVLPLQRLKVSRSLSLFLAWLAIVTILLFAFGYRDDLRFPGLLALVPCVATSILLALPKTAASKVLEGKLMVVIGNLSYSLYLWHWPLMAFIRYRNDAYTLSYMEMAIVIVLAACLSYLSFRYIETPFRFNFRRTFRYSVPTISFFIFYFWALPIIAKNRQLPPEYTKPIFGLGSHGVNNLEKFGDTTSPNPERIFVTGDSHTLALKLVLDQIGKKHNFSFVSLSSDLVPPIPEIIVDEIPFPRVSRYYESRKLVQTVLDAIERAETIVFICNDYSRFPSLITSLRSIACNLRPDQRLILLEAFPYFERNPLKLNSSIRRLADYEFVRRERVVPDAFLSLIDSHPQVINYRLSDSKVFSSAPFFNDTIMYYDDKHLNYFGANALAKDIEEDLLKILSPLEENECSFVEVR